MPRMFVLFARLGLRLIQVQFVVTLAMAAVLSAASLSEGKSIDFNRFRGIILGTSASLAAAWVLMGWRREGGDVALANLGVPPLRTVLFLCLGALPALWLAGDGSRRVPHLSLTKDRMHLKNALTVTWSESTAHRSDMTGDAAYFPGFPAPSAAAPYIYRLPVFWIRAFLLLLALLFLSTRALTPDAAITLITAGLAAGLAEGYTHLSAAGIL